MRSAPALQRRGELPAEIGGVLEAGVDAVAAVGRVAVRGVAGDEHAAGAIGVGGGDAQIPETDMVERNVEFFAGGLMQQAVEVEIVLGRAGRHRA